jgi:hypothetical protein
VEGLVRVAGTANSGLFEWICNFIYLPFENILQSKEHYKPTTFPAMVPKAAFAPGTHPTLVQHLCSSFSKGSSIP